MSDDRRMTFIVVPHAGTRDLTTRSYEISYRTLRRWVIAGGVAQVGLLERDVERLQGEVAQTRELRGMLEQLEAQKRQIDALLGEGMVRPDSSRRAVPPEDDSTQASLAPAWLGSFASNQAGLPRAWPLAARGFVTQGAVQQPSGHPGMDVAVSAGTRILAAASGVVREAGVDPVYGHFVRIAHGGGYETLYGHASRVLVAAHQQVHERQPIALSGNTGASTAPHLHFEIRKDGVPVDPRVFVHSPE
jgi:murein DD-endopeptidase MepM/ murein hydrolase activator NlpD